MSEKTEEKAVDREVVEQNAELLALAGAAAAADDELIAPQFDQGETGTAAAEPAISKQAETAAMIGAVVGMLSPVLPYLPGIYTPETVDRLAAAYQPVADKYGWDMGGWLTQYGAEIALAGTVVPLAMVTAKAHRAHVAEKQAAQEASAKAEAKPEAGPVPKPQTVVDNGGQLQPVGS